MYLLHKLTRAKIWKRLFLERLSEPLHLNLLSLFVAVFGSLRTKIFFDLYVRQQHAFGLLNAADEARAYGYKAITAIEFGVANGAGLMNICSLASRISKVTGVTFNVVGFDSGTGMPAPRDHRDHPEAYQLGWYPMQMPDELRAALPRNAKLILGEIADTLPPFLANLTPDQPIGFVSVDVDYYWSTTEALKSLASSPEYYLPLVTMYFDDVDRPIHNLWCGELAAIGEFNKEHTMRKISPFNFLRETRLFKNAQWIKKMYTLHVLDHPARFTALRDYPRVVLTNPYLRQ